MASHPQLKTHETWAKALDSKFSLFGIPIGWDSILGLVPVVGDAVTVVPAALMMRTGYREGIRKRALARMVFNTGVDLAVGSIPLVGDIFDVAFKSHTKNLGVLQAELDRQNAR